MHLQREIVLLKTAAINTNVHSAIAQIRPSFSDLKNSETIQGIKPPSISGDYDVPGTQKNHHVNPKSTDVNYSRHSVFLLAPA